MKKYHIIYADPPWFYNKRNRLNLCGNRNNFGGAGAGGHYQVMTTEKICSLGVDKIADDNSFLFLWATPPRLRDALLVMDKWGFEYKTIVFVWVKMKNDMTEPRKDGTGNYTLNNAEIVLLGRRGEYWRNSKLVKQIVLHPKEKHSKKPDEVRKRIVELVGNVSRIELFARQKTDGWDVWGNEVESDIELS